MNNVAIINSQAVGDCLLGTHTARLYKQHFPDSYITFFVRQGLAATTAEGEMLNNEILTLLIMQEGIDNVGVFDGEGVLHSYKVTPKDTFDEGIMQDSWFSDLGIVKSQSYKLIQKYPELDFNDTNTKFNIGADKQILKDGAIVIATSGPLDWNRKTKNEALRVAILNGLKEYIKNNNINARFYFMGRDVEDCNLIESLQRLNSCSLYIGPMGLPVHAAAGLGVDTIHITSVFPPEYDSPKFYHNGWHRPIKSKNHCLTYSCISEKLFSKEVYPEGPPTKYGFWPKYCDLTTNGKSCVYNTEAKQVIDAFDEWYNEVGKHL
jgi:hypothetical protein